MVDVNGSQIAVEVRGTKEPAVVFLSGVTDDRRVWDAVIDLLPTDALTIAADRPGLGDSSPLPTHRRGSPAGLMSTVGDLHTLLQALSVHRPVILVGHSLGALLAVAYGASHPEECAGLILVDPSDPALLPPLAGFHDTLPDSDQGIIFSWHAVGEDVSRLPTPTAPAVVIASAPGRWHRVPDPDSYKPLTMAQIDTQWQRWQYHIATRLHGTLVIATRAGHRVHTEAPELVAEVIKTVLLATRASHRPAITAEHLSRLPAVVVPQTA